MSNVGKVCFKNGVYNFKTKEFKTWDDDNQTLSTIYIDRNYQYMDFDVDSTDENTKIGFLNNVFIHPILGKDDKCKFMLNWLARGSSGCWTEKTWCSGIGNRDCGKGVLTDLISRTLGKYCCSFTAKELIEHSALDTGRSMGWTIPMQFTRINISNEIPTKDRNGKRTKFNGDLIKTIASGGDTIVAREVYKECVRYKLQGRFMFLMNDMPEISVADAKQTLVTHNFNSIFVNELTEEQLEINKMETITYYKSNPNIKMLLDDDELIMTFFNLLAKSYTNEPLPVPQSNIDDKDDVEVEDDVEKLLKETFIFTKQKTDKIPATEVNAYFKEYNNISRNNFIKTIRRLGGSNDGRDSKGYRMYIGMKYKNNDDNSLDILID